MKALSVNSPVVASVEYLERPSGVLSEVVGCERKVDSVPLRIAMPI
jgi:hypothetical protein